MARGRKRLEDITKEKLESKEVVKPLSKGLLTFPSKKYVVESTKGLLTEV